MQPTLPLFLCLLSVTTPLAAAGLGELDVHSRIGQAFAASISIIADPEEELDASCFALAPVPNAELPVISSARLRLIRENEQTLLHITATEALQEPLAVLRLRAGCGIELLRDYFVMPMPPANQPVVNYTVGEPVARPIVAPTMAQPRPAKPGRATPRPPPIAHGDRLILASTTMQLDYGLPPSMAQETDSRLLRMETSLSQLHASLQKLESAMLIDRDIQAATQELQLAIALHQPTAAGPLPDARDTWQHWLALLGGMLLGGGACALALHYLSRLRPGYRDR